MKIIDFERKGNVVRYYLGDDDCEDYWGDDWNDAPYDCNAGCVSRKYVKATKDIAYPFDYLVLEPCVGDDNCGFTKEDMKERKCPCIIVVPTELAEQHWRDDYQFWIGNNGVKRIYFGDKMNADTVGIEEFEQYAVKVIENEG